MSKNPRIAPYLMKRNSRWYFRFRVPIAIQSLAGRSELRVSLNTSSLKVAKNLLPEALPYVYELKRLTRRMKQLEPDHVRTALDRIFTELVETLEHSKEPWMRGQHRGQSLVTGINIGGQELATINEYKQLSAANDARKAVKSRDPSRWVNSACNQLQTLGVAPDLESQLFKDFCVEIGKLELLFLDAQAARLVGDFETEESSIGYFKRNGYNVVPTAISVLGHGPKLSEAWAEYFEEKTAGTPDPHWKDKTARGHQATFDEFLELVTDIRANQVTRMVMQNYLSRVAKLPKNRKKLYGEKSASELLAMDFKESQLPSSRTIAEKLVQIGSFLKWCRVSKTYIESDPTEGITVRSSSRSYAPFTQSDLKVLFENVRYSENKHRTMWHFWVPLLALYTGARQTEIGQLLLDNIVEEDGNWVLAITDLAEGQRVKTRAGVRKVPISSHLIEIGFIEYTQSLKSLGEVRLLPDLPKGKHGWGQKISRWFNDTYKKRCGIEPDPTGGRKVFHSFRHTAITKATSSGLPIQLCQQVFGHEKSVLGETATYTHQYPVSALLPVVEALDFGIDHSAILGSWRSYLSSTEETQMTTIRKGQS